ncbi:hypothetical protein GCM10028809_55920 [Spirosoma gilvum]
MCRNRDASQDKRKKDEPVFYWLTSLDNVHTATELYRKRWRIEQCFKALKSNGFNLQAMNFKKTSKIELLLAVVMFAYVLSIIEGETHQQQIPTKNYADLTTAPAQSLFKKGLDLLNAKLIWFEQFLVYLQTIYQLISKRRFQFVQ